MSEPAMLDDGNGLYFDYWDEEADCSWCGGEGTEECGDPIQCCKKHYGGSPFDGGAHDCSSCGGTGKAKDQTLW